MVKSKHQTKQGNQNIRQNMNNKTQDEKGLTKHKTITVIKTQDKI